MKTCLVADDSRVVRIVARRILETLKFQVFEAADGAEAVDQCRLGMPDVILLDQRMPALSGLDVLTQLRATPGGERVKVVFCSSEADLGFIRSALEQGADEYVIKPFDAEILATKLALAGAA